MAGHVRLYEAHVTWTGNRGQGTSTHKGYGRDHYACGERKPDLLLSSDPAFLGDATRYNPEELLVVAISSCHMLWYLHLCVDARIVVQVYEDRPSGRLAETQGSIGGHFVSVLLRPRVIIESGDIQEALRLHEDAHQKCFIANSVNFPVLFEPFIEPAPKPKP